MLFGHDERVPRHLGKLVEEGNDPLVFIHNLCMCVASASDHGCGLDADSSENSKRRDAHAKRNC